MRFAAPIWLYVIPALPALWLLLRAGDRRAAGRLRRLLGERAGDHVESANPRLRTWRRFLLLWGLFWLLLALARPQWGASEVAVSQRGSDIVVALDISNSMLAEDVPPNRIERAKAELGSFLERLRDSRVGLVFFAGSAFVQCPLTMDYGTADIFLKMAEPDMLSEQGTALGAALETSRQLLLKGREGKTGGTFQAILLVTDGEDLEGSWEDAAKACQRDGIKLIPVGVGEEEGGLIPVTDNQGRPAGFMKDDQGNVVLSRLDTESLGRMAAISGGSLFRIGVDGLAGDRLFAELERLGKRDLEERRISAYQERYVWPLLLAALCFALRLLLAPRRRAAAGSAVLAVLAVVLLAAAPASASLRPPGAADLQTGREKYLQGDYDGALHDLESALVAAPDDPLISLAMGETLFRLQRYDEAAREFARTLTLTDDPRLQAEARYNAGTTLLAAGKTDAAVQQLRESLRLDPDPEDAQLNLEAALRRQRQEEQQQQQQDKDKDKQDQQDKDQQNKDQQQQDQQQKDQQQQDQQQQDQQQQDQQQQDQQQQDQQQQDQQQKDQQQQDQQQKDKQQDQQQAQAQPDSLDQASSEQLTREQALQILKALDRDEEELKKSVQKRLRGGRPRSGKRW